MFDYLVNPRRHHCRKKWFVLLVFLFASTAGFDAFSQSVGIGTQTPAEKLDVNGNLKADTAKINSLKITTGAASGKVLTSDASGIGSWQNAPGNLKAANGLNKSGDSIKIGGLLTENSRIRLNANALIFADTGSQSALSLSQTDFSSATSLSSVAITQSFTSVCNCSLASVDLYVAVFGGATITLQVKDADGNLLSSATHSYSGISNDWDTFPLNGAALSAGNMYTLSVSCTGPAQLHYSASDPYVNGSSSIGTATDIAFRVFTTADKELLFLQGNKIGIANTSPAATLDIAGNLKITDGSQGNGKLLTSDASGFASWQLLNAVNYGGWGTTGNAGTTGLNFLGTTDNQPLRIRLNNQPAGLMDQINRNYSLGFGAGENLVASAGNVAFGHAALKTNTTPANNTAIGDSALFNSGGTGFSGAADNTAVGAKAMVSNTGGNANTATGYSALYANGSGTGNTAAGKGSLLQNKTGSFNTAIGLSAAASNDTSHNIALGAFALYNNSKGSPNIAIGNFALYQNSDRKGNIAVGDSALFANGQGASAALQGISNLAIGEKAMRTNTTGSFNLAIGKSALKSNLGGINNIAIGTEALFSHANGDDNVAMGHNSMRNTGTGLANTSIGSYAMGNYNGGSYNVAIGVSALFSGSGGINNTAVGVDAASAAISNGSHNAAFGTQAMNNGTGSRNTAIGFRAYAGAAFSTTVIGNGNIAVGANALQNAPGNFQIAIGDSALYGTDISPVTNTNLVAIGKNALQKVNGANGNTAIGHFALATLVNNTGNTAVGTFALNKQTSSFSTAVGYNALAVSFTNSNTAVGYNSLASSTGLGNTAIGQSSGLTCITCIENTFAGNLADATVTNLNNAAAFGARAFVNASNKVRIGSSAVTVIEGQVGWSFPSDGRFKSDVRTDVPGLALVNLLRPVSYHFETETYQRFVGVPDSLIAETKASNVAASAIRHTGFIAQELEAALKESGYQFSGLHTPSHEKDNYSIAYDNFVPILVKAIQEQQQEIGELKKQISELNRRLEEKK